MNDLVLGWILISFSLLSVIIIALAHIVNGMRVNRSKFRAIVSILKGRATIYGTRIQFSHGGKMHRMNLQDCEIFIGDETIIEPRD